MHATRRSASHLVDSGPFNIAPQAIDCNDRICVIFVGLFKFDLCSIFRAHVLIPFECKAFLCPPSYAAQLIMTGIILKPNVPYRIQNVFTGQFLEYLNEDNTLLGLFKDNDRQKVSAVTLPRKSSKLSIITSVDVPSSQRQAKIAVMERQNTTCKRRHVPHFLELRYSYAVRH